MTCLRSWQSGRQTVTGLVHATRAILYAEFVSDTARLTVNIATIHQTGGMLAGERN